MHDNNKRTKEPPAGQVHSARDYRDGKWSTIHENGGVLWPVGQCIDFPIDKNNIISLSLPMRAAFTIYLLTVDGESIGGVTD